MQRMQVQPLIDWGTKIPHAAEELKARLPQLESLLVATTKAHMLQSPLTTARESVHCNERSRVTQYFLKNMRLY